MEMSTERRATNEQLPMITSLPEELVVDIIARMPRCNYPTISLVSKCFRSIVVSPELYARRSLLGRTEQCLYVALYNIDNNQNRWYMLHRKGNSYRLVLIPSLPCVPSDASFASVGSRIYVLGGHYNYDWVSSALSIDCGSHTAQPLPRLPMPMHYPVANTIDKKIYVIGQIDWGKYRVMVFDTKTQLWESGMTEADVDLNSMQSSCGVGADKMYIRDSKNSFVYMPKESKWEMVKTLNSEKWVSVCVVEDILYYYDYFVNRLKAYDLKKRRWTKVNGVGKLSSKPKFLPRRSQTVSYDGKLLVFLHVSDDSRGNIEIWCAEISVKRLRRGNIQGKVERIRVVIDGKFVLQKSLVVMV